VKDLIIIGAGGSSQQIACAVEDINQRESLWNLRGFLDGGQRQLSWPLGVNYSGRLAVCSEFE